MFVDSVQSFDNRIVLVLVLVCWLPLKLKQFIILLLVLVQTGLEHSCYEVFHLIFGLAVNHIQRFLRQLHVARPGVGVVVLKHNLDNVVDFDIAAVANNVLHYFNGPVLLVFVLLLSFLDSVCGLVLRDVDGFLQLEFLQQPEQEETHLNLVVLGEARLSRLLVALVNQVLSHLLCLRF